MEVQYAQVNLGIVLLKQRRFAEATNQFAGATQTIEAVAAVDRNSSEYQKSLAATLGWLADAELWQGHVNDAIVHRERLVALLQRLSQQSNADVDYREKLIPAERSLGKLFAARGQRAQAEQHLRAAVATASDLIPREPGNTHWLDYSAIARLTLAQYLLSVGNRTEANVETNAGCDIVRQLLARDRAVVNWRADQQVCLATRAELALASGDLKRAEDLARQSLAIARGLKGGDAIADRYVVAQSQRLLGDVYRSTGDLESARAAWRTGLSALPADVPERPWEAAGRAQLSSRLGDPSQLHRVTMQLNSMGIRNAEILKI
jgi:tetratricopeptide (TPR) repeat protein